MTLDELRECTRATLTLQEVAETLSVDYRTVGRACDDGSLPSITLGRRRLVPTARLLNLLIGNPIDEAAHIPGNGELASHVSLPQ